MNDTERMRDYERLSRHVDRRLALYAHETIAEALRLANLTGTEAVLDACCGTGDLLQLLALRGHRGPLIGVDFSEMMLNVARHRLRNYPNIILKTSNIFDLDAPSDYFHLIFNTNAFRYLDQPRAALAEFRRVLRPHGRLILVDLAANSRWTRAWTQLRRLIRPMHRTLYHIDELAELLRAAGFVVTRKKLWRVNLIWSVMLLEANNPAPAPSRQATPKLEYRNPKPG